MNLNYAIFRSEHIMTINDLAQIGSHNKREKKAYKSNPDIDISKSKDNIELVPLSEKYVKGFYNLTREYKKEHEERMKTERKDRKRTFKQMLDKSNNVVADELLFTGTYNFFDGMDRNQIKDWADTCMEFVYKDLGYTKEQVLLSVVHLDEETPHIHCVVVPLVNKLDNRTNTYRYTISKKQYIKDKKETFKSMNNVTKENNSLMKVQERVERVFKTVDEHIKSYDTLEEENLKLNREVINLIYKNNDLKLENNKLKNFIYNLLEKLKKLFRKILFRGDYELKDLVCDQVKDIYDNKEFDNKDVYNISKGTKKQDELFEYADIPSYMKENIKYNYEEDRDNVFEI